MDVVQTNFDNSKQLANSAQGTSNLGSIDAKAAVHKVPPVKKVDIDREPTISRGELSQRIEQLNKELVSRNQAVAFSSDAATGRDIVRVTNRTTGDLIRQMPSAEALKAMQNIDQMMGLIFNKST